MFRRIKLCQKPLFSNPQGATDAKGTKSLAKYWLRMTDQPNPRQIALIGELQRYSCATVLASQASADLGTAVEDETHALSVAASHQQLASARSSKSSVSLFPRPVQSISSQSGFVASTLSSFGAVEWLMVNFSGVAPADRSLGVFGQDVPVDIDSPERLEQRLSILRQSVDAQTPIGLGFTLAGALANMRLIAELPVDFISLIDPISVLGKDHPAARWFDDDIPEVVSQIVQLKRELGREDMSVVLQAHLQSGYEVAAYRALGVDTFVLNGFDWIGELDRRSAQQDAFAASFLGTAVSVSSEDVDRENLAAKVDTFFQQVAEGDAYAGSLR